MFRLKSIVLFFVFGCCTFQGVAQKYIKPYGGGNFSNRILSSDNATRKDSLDKADRFKIFPNGGVQFLFEKKSGREFYFGLGYNEIGFIRERLDYQFQDTVHPDLGIIMDLSQAAQKNGYFTYRFKYIEMPLGFNFQFTPRQLMNVYTGWFNIGINAQYLMKQHMTIFLQGFSMKGEHRFDFENTSYDAAQFNMALQAGGRFDIKLDRKTWVTADALFKLQLLNTAVNPSENLRGWYMSLNLGLRREIGDW
jgi:hypothetical protein